MDNTINRFAYRCLPMLMANQCGWFLLNPHDVRITWSGGSQPDAIRIEYRDVIPEFPLVSSHFGRGVVTWKIPVLFRTSSEFDLLFRGPPNWPKPGAYPLEGLVETDWSIATATMNWQLLIPGLPVVFRSDEPFCMIVPQKRGALDMLAPISVPIDENAALARHYREWAAGREQFYSQHPSADEWQKEYFRGNFEGHAAASYHRTRMKVSEFDVR